MESITSLKPVLAVAVSLVATVLIAASDRVPRVREAWTLMAALGKFALVASMLPEIRRYGTIEAPAMPLLPGVALAFRVDALGLAFALLASGLWVLTSVYSIGYMRALNEHKQTRYFASFALSLTATIGTAFAANLLTLIIFNELLTVATYPLVIHKESKEAVAAGRKYLFYTLSGGLMLLLATVWTYLLAGTLDFRPGGFLHAVPESATVLFWLFVAGFGVKAALMPLHGWLPAAMVAPTPVSALLHAVAVVKAGVFTGLRVLGYVFGPEALASTGGRGVLAAVAGISLILASLMALRQDHLKRRLAYSTVANLSYIILGAALLTPASWIGAVFHMAAHAFLKITLFFCAGTIYVGTHKEYVSELDGVGHRMPVTMIAFALASVGVTGLPPTAGFVSKWYLGLGAHEAGAPWFGWILLASSLLNAAYFFPIVHRAFFRAPGTTPNPVERSLLPLVGVLTCTVLLGWIYGMVPGLPAFWELGQKSAVEVTGWGLRP